jgi:Nif-specific regulatory protein
MQTSPLRESHSRPKASEVMVEGIYEAARALASAPPPRSLQNMLDVLSSFLELQAASLTMFGEKSAMDIVLNSSALHTNMPALIPLTRAAARRVAGTHMPLVVESVWAELSDLEDVASSWRDTDLDESLICVPVKEDGKTIAALAIVREHSAGDQAGFFFDADVRMLGSVANLVGLALRLSRLATNDSDDVPALRPSSRPSPPPLEASGAVLGAAPCWRATVRRAQVAARTNASVLLRGETGTGKNLVARLVHDASLRRGRPFVVVNCAALSESLLESELFGHEKGSFTGAVGQRKGRFELADGGTLFLDEIGEISAAFQAKVLRVLQQGEFERVGGTTTLKVDVRIIAATHRDLEAAVAAGAFRADLYYRLCVVPIRVPPLRERAEDISLLAHTLLERFNQENGSSRAISDEAIDALTRYSFPGNVRELENAIRRAASLSDKRTLTVEDFSFLCTASDGERESALPEPPSSSAAAPLDLPQGDFAGGNRLVDRERLVEALEQTGWVLARAARHLGMTPRQVGYAVQKHAIPIRKY